MVVTTVLGKFTAGQNCLWPATTTNKSKKVLVSLMDAQATSG